MDLQEDCVRGRDLMMEEHGELTDGGAVDLTPGVGGWGGKTDE